MKSVLIRVDPMFNDYLIKYAIPALKQQNEKLKLNMPKVDGVIVTRILGQRLIETKQDEANLPQKKKSIEIFDVV